MVIVTVVDYRQYDNNLTYAYGLRWFVMHYNKIVDVI